MGDRRQGRTIVLLGHLGSGKSSTGNVIAGRKNAFATATSMVAVTKEVKAVQACVDSCSFTIVDTPGLETAGEFDKFKDEIKNKYRGDCVYAIVIRTGRYTQEERKMLEDLIKKNKNTFQEKLIMIFTNCKELCNEDNKAAKQNFDKWLSDLPTLRKLIDENNIQYFQFENVKATEAEKRANVHSLLYALDISKSGQIKTELMEFEPQEPFVEEDTISVTERELVDEFGKNAKKFFAEKKKNKQK